MSPFPPDLRFSAGGALSPASPSLRPWSASVAGLTLAVVAGLASPALADGPPLIPEAQFAAIARETSGEQAKRDLEFLSRQHRMRASRQFQASAEYIASRLREAGLEEVRVDPLPADGQVFYGTQRSRPAWNVDFAELWEMGDRGGASSPLERIASWDAQPITLAQDSWSGEIETDLVDVGYAYEALNLVDGRRTVKQIRDDLSAIFGPVPVDLVSEYLAALQKIEVIRRAPVR